tara:strand:- start:275 stop:457 length:183 start_codon:yes stop_codon:yes gene_type:complete
MARLKTINTTKRMHKKNIGNSIGCSKVNGPKDFGYSDEFSKILIKKFVLAIKKSIKKEDK